MDDMVPATLEGEQDVVLSDGEFIVPADVVCGLGNGSSDAGSEALYEMMDRVIQEVSARHKKELGFGIPDNVKIIKDNVKIDIDRWKELENLELARSHNLIKFHRRECYQHDDVCGSQRGRERCLG